SGIIYCTSKKNCEMMAHDLRTRYRLRAEHYHAGLDKEDRARVQQAWQHNELQVIVATIAFGMGIDKPDVRFVIHHSLPNSLEGYYQETGRAGRDGKAAICVLFYSFRDKASVDFMIDRGDGDWEVKERQRQQLRQVVQFCENITDCRRQLVLSYFGEQFDVEKCNKSCDNCRKQSQTTLVEANMAREACALIETVQTLASRGHKTTLLQLTDIFRGAKTKRIMDRGDDSLPAYGMGKGLTRTDADRLCQHLVLRQVLDEFCESNAAGYVCTYVRLGAAASRISSGQLPVLLQLTNTKQAKAAAGGSKTGKSATKQAAASKMSGSSRSNAGGMDAAQTVVTRDTSTHFGLAASKAGGNSRAAATSIKPMTKRGSRP
ncbi:ATP-dependent DNA helicase sgs1, partial [Coemansia sp. BCRC 34301]